MAGILAFARADLRRRWRSVLVLALLVAMSGAVILTALSGARRTDTVVSRLNARTEPADVLVLPNQQGFDWSKVRTLPAVDRLGTFVLTEATPQAVDGHGRPINLDNTMGFPGGDLIQNRTVEGTALISGREANPHNPDEIIASPGFTKKYGDEITVTFPSPQQAAGLAHGQSVPAGEKLTGRVAHLHVVGVGVNTFDLGTGGGPVFEPTYAFFTDYIKGLIPYFENAAVILNGGVAAIPEFQKQLAAATGNPNIQVDNWHENVRVIQRAATFTAEAWALFALIALIAAAVLIGQAFVRFSAAAADDLRTLAALGMGRRQTRVAASLAPAIAAVIGIVAAVPLAVVGSRFFPTGIGHGYEAEPGISANWAILGLGAVVLTAIAVAGARLAGTAAMRDHADERDRPSAIVSFTRRAGFGITTVLGTRFALESGRGRTRVPVKPALIGAVAGVLGVTGALTFRTGVNGTVDNLSRFGQSWGDVAFISEGAPPKSYAAALAQFAKDPNLAMLDDLRVASLSINGRTTSVTSITPLVGYPHIVTLSGQAPATDREISIGPTTAHDLGLHVGSTVTVGDGVKMTVTGITFVPENPHNDYADGAWLTTEGFAAAAPNESLDKFHEAIFTFKPGVSQQAGLKGVPKGIALGGAGPVSAFLTPDQVVELRSLRPQPLLLGGFLMLLAIGAVGHGLATAVRRRRRDVAVLRALGMTRLQTRLIVVTQATVVALVGLVVGLPLGVAVGRTVWRVLADATPVYYVAPFAIVGLLLAIPAAIGAANLLATLPARRAARLRVSDILRAE